MTRAEQALQIPPQTTTQMSASAQRGRALLSYGRREHEPSTRSPACSTRSHREDAADGRRPDPGALCRPEVAAHLIAAWQQSTPKVQEEIIAALGFAPGLGLPVARCLRLRRDHCPARCPPAHADALLAITMLCVREHAQKLFGDAAGSRAEVIARYHRPLALTGDAAPRRAGLRARVHGLPPAGRTRISGGPQPGVDSQSHAGRTARSDSGSQSRSAAQLCQLCRHRRQRPHDDRVDRGRNGHQHHAGPRQGRHAKRSRSKTSSRSRAPASR